MTDKRPARTALQIAADTVDAAHSKLAYAEAAALKGKDFVLASTIADARKTVLAVLNGMTAKVTPAAQ